MKIITHSYLKNTLLALVCLGALAATPARAVLVTWNLNPNGTEGDAGTSSYTFTSSGYNITAYGYTLGLPSTPLNLYFKNQGSDETGLGIVGPSDHELQGSGWYPLQFIQLSVSSILSKGFTNGQIEIGSVQSGSNDTFMLFGSNTQGTLGTAISGLYTSTSDLTFLDIANWGTYQYIGIGAISGDVLPVAFQATCVPEMSALFPIVGLVTAVSCTHLLRRRRRSGNAKG